MKIGETMDRDNSKIIISLYDYYNYDYIGVFIKDNMCYVVGECLKIIKIYERLEEAIVYMLEEYWGFGHTITICDEYKEKIYVDTANYTVTIDKIKYDF